MDVLLSVTRDGSQTLGAQIEGHLRRAIRDGALRPGARIPSTRDLAGQLGVSRRVVVEAYAQLAAEGYVSLRHGVRPSVSETAAHSGAATLPAGRPASRARFDFLPSTPDVSAFPRSAWMRSLRESLATMPDADLGYGDPRGVTELRSALADYLGRVRGVIADPENILITNGYTQSLSLICHALAAGGSRRIAFENPCNPEDRIAAARAGLEPVSFEVDDFGARIDELLCSGSDAVVVTPAHQHPTGVVLSGRRRTALLAWLRERDAIAIEDDYDAEYRYDRSAVGALQGLDPDRVLYAGSASKTLAPALRIGWLVVPPSLVGALTAEKVQADRGTARIEQHAFADFLGRGELDRHLRRMRTRYRSRRDALIEALTTALPETKIRGIAAGLHVTVELPDTDDEHLVREEARSRSIELETMSDYMSEPAGHRPALLLGYAQMPEPTIIAGIRGLAAAVAAARARR